MPEEKCGNCKFHIGNNAAQMWCARHAPVVMANPGYSEEGDRRIFLSEHPEVYSEAYCGDFELMEKKDGD